MSIYAILGVEFFMNYGESGSYTNELGEVVEITTARDLQYGCRTAMPSLARAQMGDMRTSYRATRKEWTNIPTARHSYGSMMVFRATVIDSLKHYSVHFWHDQLNRKG